MKDLFEGIMAILARQNLYLGMFPNEFLCMYFCSEWEQMKEILDRAEEIQVDIVNSTNQESSTHLKASQWELCLIHECYSSKNP